MSAYENERTFPELDTLERIVRAADAELALAARGTSRCTAQFALLRDAVQANDRSWALRLVAELVSWIRTDVVSIECVKQDPGTLGDDRWDALVAGVTEMLCSEAGASVPAWASSPGRVLDEMWFYSDFSSLRAHIFVTTPAALAARGVYLSADSLTSV
jgi:hypothetical protein